ncbi:MAG: AEC family transporter [Clostridiales bacterium]|nr:AEC family transporter [Clostridiales bacterium]
MHFTLLATYNVTVMFILIGVGCLSYRLGMINNGGAKQLTNILLNIVTPCIIISSFQIDYEKSLAFKLAIAVIVAIVMHLTGIIIAKFAFRHLPYSSQCIYRYSSFLPNCGYLTLPLAFSLLGNTGVIYVSVFIATTSFFTWTYGLRLFSGENVSVPLSKAFLNPGVISVAIAIPVFLFSIKFPSVILDPMKSLASLNTPVAMIITGVYIAQTDLITSIKNKFIYLVVAIRQFIVPAIVGAIMLLILYILGSQAMDSTLFLASMLASAAPAATSTSLFAAKCNADVVLASKTVAITTLLYIATISIMVYLSTLVLGM